MYVYIHMYNSILVFSRRYLVGAHLFENSYLCVHNNAGAAGGASGGGGGGGGGLVLLIDQVQFMNKVGRVQGSGSEAHEGSAAFSQGFAWANFDFPVEGVGNDENGGRRADAKSATIHCNSTTDCNASEKKIWLKANKHWCRGAKACHFCSKACSWCEGAPVLKRVVTCIGVLAGVGFIRELIGWVYHYKFPTKVRALPREHAHTPPLHT